MTTHPPIATNANAPHAASIKTLAELCDVMVALFLRRGRTSDQALIEAKEVVLEISNLFGGRQVYIPRGSRLKIALRDAEIWTRFNGANTDALAKEYGVTTIHMYSLLAKQRALRRCEHESAISDELRKGLDL